MCGLDWSIPEESPFFDPDFIEPVEGKDYDLIPSSDSDKEAENGNTDN